MQLHLLCVETTKEANFTLGDKYPYIIGEWCYYTVNDLEEKLPLSCVEEGVKFTIKEGKHWV